MRMGWIDCPFSLLSFAAEPAAPYQVYILSLYPTPWFHLCMLSSRLPFFYFQKTIKGAFGGEAKGPREVLRNSKGKKSFARLVSPDSNDASLGYIHVPLVSFKGLSVDN